MTNTGLAEAKFVGLWRFQIIYSFINIFWIWLCAFLEIFSTLAQNQLERYFGVKERNKNRSQYLAPSPWNPCHLMCCVAMKTGMSLCPFFTICSWKYWCWRCFGLLPIVRGTTQTLHLAVCTAPVVMLRPHVHKTRAPLLNRYPLVICALALLWWQPIYTCRCYKMRLIIQSIHGQDHIVLHSVMVQLQSFSLSQLSCQRVI